MQENYPCWLLLQFEFDSQEQWANRIYKVKPWRNYIYFDYRTTVYRYRSLLIGVMCAVQGMCYIVFLFRNPHPIVILLSFVFSLNKRIEIVLIALQSQ